MGRMGRMRRVKVLSVVLGALTLATMGWLLWPIHVDAAGVFVSMGPGSDVMCYEETGYNTMSLEVSMGVASRLEGILIHLSAAGTGTLTASVDSGLGAEYDTTLLSQNMATGGYLVGTDLVRWWAPSGPLLMKDDWLSLSWPNSTGRTWGLTVFFSTE
jgi:hypothetical protein